MYIDYSPGYPATCRETYFGTLASAASEISSQCVRTVCELEQVMPMAWEGWKALIALNDGVPPDGECRKAYEHLRSAFSALHGSCVVEAQDIMFTACRAPDLDVRTGIIGKALREASAAPGVKDDDHTGRGSGHAVELLRTALWVDPFAFLRAIRGRTSPKVLPCLTAPPERWAAFAQAAMQGRSISRRLHEAPSELGCVRVSTEARSEGVSGETMRPALSLAVAADALGKAAAPEPVAHIVASCVARYAAYETAIARCPRETYP